MDTPAKVLVADDDDDFRGMICDYLTEEGYTVIEASDGLQAFDKTLNERPDVLLLDVMMPGRGGYDVCRDLKIAERQDHKCIVVMLTAKASLQDKLAGFMSGASRYICKPCQLSEISECIETALTQRSITERSIDD
ncbi:MAG TPA: response regulator [bacterium]|nr:response regulator [bacterium]